MLTDQEIAAFVEDGFTVVRDVVPPRALEGCRRVIDDMLGRGGIDRGDPSTWADPVVRLPCPIDDWWFSEAASQARLWEAYDQLVGPDVWVRRRTMSGTVIARFPHPVEPFDTGWHIDGGFEAGGDWLVSLSSRHRALLCFVLFTDIGPDDAPTELKVGSHLDVPAMLAPFGPSGTSYRTIANSVTPETLARPSVWATGRAGDVYLCHPFLVHRAPWPNRLRRPRLLAQTAVNIDGALELGPTATCPVEEAILRGLRTGTVTMGHR